MADLKISDLSALSGSDLVAADELAIVDDSASETKKITVSNLIANGVTLISDDAIPGAKILFGAGDIATAALADSAVTSAKIGADQVTAAKIADNTIVNLVSDLPTSGDYTGQLALDTDDNSLYVYSGSAWLNTKAPGSVNAFTDTTSGIINISTVVSSGTATITASIDNTASAAQFLAGPVGSGGTVGYRTIDGGDLPAATTTSKGGVIVNGGGLTVSTDTIQIDNSVTASSVKHLVTYDANGLINGGSAISSSDLPVATTSAKGAVIASDGLAVDANGNLSIDNTITAGTYTKVTVTSKGVVSAGDVLTAADIPDHSAAKLTSGTIDSSRIASDAITAAKLADQSTVKFGGALGSDNVTIFPDGDFKGQLFWDETSLDLYVYTGSAFIPITVLSGNLVNAGTYNANTNLVSSVTTAGSSAGFSAGSALPAPTGANLNHYLVVDTSGTGSGAAPAVALAPPDMLLSNGVGTEYRLIDVSNAIAGQTAANISFIASGTIAATDVQAALQEVDAEKLAKAGGTMTGDLNLGTSTNVVFEGSSADDFETTLTVTDPTADRTITLPNVTGTVVTTGDTGSVTSTMITNGTIVNADINASAEIAVSKLANGTARQLLQTDSGGTGVEFTSNVDVPGTLDVTNAATFDSTVAVTGLLSANGKLAYPAGSAAAVSLYSGSDTDTGIYSPGSNQFGIATAGTSRIVVDASGNVGVGETSPTDKLHIATSSNDDGILVKTTGNNSNALDFDANRSGANNAIASIRGRWNGTTVGQISFISGGDTTNKNDGVITFGTEATASSGNVNASEKMRIDSDGKLLLGLSGTLTNGTDAKFGILQIEGNSSNNSGAGIISVARGQSASSISADIPLGIVAFTDNTGNTFASMSALADAAPGSDDYPGRIVFSTTADGASSPDPRMTIDNGGNVGIGTTSAGANLEVQGGTTSSGPGGEIRISSKDQTISANNVLGSLTFKNNDSSTGMVGVMAKIDAIANRTYDGDNACGMDLGFFAGTKGDGVDSPPQRMRIYSSGNIQIGEFDGADYSKEGNFIYSSGQFRVVRETGSDRIYSGFLGSTQTVDIRADGSATFAGRASIGADNLGNYAIVAKNESSTLPNVYARNYSTASTALVFAGYDDGSATVPTSKIFSSGAAEFAGPVEVKQNLSNTFASPAFVVSNASQDQVIRLNNNGSATFADTVSVQDPDTSDAAAVGTAVHGGLLVVKRESTAGSDKNVFIGYKGTDWTSFISATGSAQFKDGSSIVAGVNGGSAVFYGGDSNTTSQSNSKFRINSNGSATFANGAFDITASGTTQITNPASNADAIQVYGPGGNTVFARVKNNGDAYFGGKVGIGTTGPTELLGIGFADNSTGAIEFRTATYSKVAQIKGSHDSGTANGSLRFHTRNGGDEFERMKIASTGLISAPGVYSFTTASSANVIVESAGQLSRATSSAKYKRNVETLEDSYADAILNCRPVWYQSKSELDNPNYGFWGFIAEEVAEIDPRLVQWKTNEITYDENRSVVATPCEPEPESVAYDRFVPHLLNIIKRQQTAIENLEAKVAALEAG